MKISYINYQQTKNFSSDLIRYLAEDLDLLPFVSYWPSLDGFGQLLKNRTGVVNRRILVDILKRQYVDILSLEKSESVWSNIELLNSENTFTVTTGHQLNLFTGPLYFIYKIVSAINLAKELTSRFPGKNFIPIYWMASEDHDFKEINHAFINNKEVTWDQIAHGAVGQLPLAQIDSALKKYISLLGLSAQAEKIAAIVTNAYTQHTTLADATRYLVHQLFNSYGLVVVDANHPLLKKEFESVILQDIIEQNSYRLIESTNQKLKDRGIEARINPREINFFYFLNNSRERLIFKDNRYLVLNTSIVFTEQELRVEIENYPERFSPNVVMRPLYQETVLPNVAYVGGGAEISYWLQLKETFNHYKVNFPILVLRNSALIVNGKLGANLKYLNLSLLDIFNDIETLEKEWTIRQASYSLELSKEWKELQSIFEKINKNVSKVDTTLGPSTEAIKARLYRMIQSLEKKMIKAEKRKHGDTLAALRHIKYELFPRGILQERIENFGSFYVKYGESFIDLLIENFKPLDFQYTIFQEEINTI